MFDDQRLYMANDRRCAQSLPTSTMAHWRCEGRGPAYVKLGSRVAYSGRALNEWLAARTVQPKETA